MSLKPLAEILVETAARDGEEDCSRDRVVRLVRDTFPVARDRLLPTSQVEQILGTEVMASMALTKNVKISLCCLVRENTKQAAGMMKCSLRRKHVLVDM